MKKTNEPQDGKNKGLLARVIDSVAGTQQEEPDSPSATEILKSQHDEVRALFKEYEKSGENAHATRKRLIGEASDKLEVHAELEEKIFYPACRELGDEDARKMVGESMEEHLIVKRLIKELRGLDGSSDLFESKATVLKESVEHHADEEEKDLFPAAKKELSQEELEDLGRKMLALQTLSSAKASSKTRPSSKKPVART
jgi:hemerythrin-like domain-containing protein